jgi:hypothetical protein
VRWFRKARVVLRLVMSRDEVFTEANAAEWKRICDGSMWRKLRTMLNNDLVNAILNGASDDYRLGYLAALSKAEGYAGMAPQVVSEDKSPEAIQLPDEDRAMQEILEDGSAVDAENEIWPT